jgi:mono/diheme cytochrome c family protein
MKKRIAISVITSFGIFMSACGGGQSAGSAPAAATVTPAPAVANPDQYDPKRGEGKFKDITVGDKLDEAIAATGKKVFDVKCSACHKLTEEKLVGPGWKGVTSRRQPAWIMNFITNTDEMINKDPAAQALLELCLVRMPNQSLSDEDARGALEYMRKNDGVK